MFSLDDSKTDYQDTSPYTFRCYAHLPRAPYGIVLGMNNPFRSFLKHKITAKVTGPLIVLGYPIAVAWMLTRLVYPGFMSYDTIYALDSARGQVTSSAWPPMVSYVWRAIDFFSTDPSAMHFFQLALLLVSLSVALRELSPKTWTPIAVIASLLLVPVTAGTMAVIWKDVLTSGFMLAAFAVALFIPRLKLKKSRTLIFLALVLFLSFVFLALTTRHNSILGVFPIIFFASFLMLERGVNKSGLKSLVQISALSLIITAPLYGGKILLDNYSIPEFQRIEGTAGVLPVTQQLDLIGASVCADTNFLADAAPGLSLDEIRDGYDARHVNLSANVLARITKPEEVASQWNEVLLSNPICLMSNRAQLFVALFGLNAGEQFLITAPLIYENDYGYTLEPSLLRDLYVGYIYVLSFFPILRPWFVALAALGGILLLYRRRLVTVPIITLAASSVAYASGLIIAGSAADARLLFHTNLISLMICFIAYSKLKKFQKSNKIDHSRQP